MLISAIIGQSINKTEELIKSLFSSTGKKISIIQMKVLKDLNYKKYKDYLLELERNGIDFLIIKVDILEIKYLFNGLKFDIIFYTDKFEDFSEDENLKYKDLMKKAFEFLDENGIAIVNVDDIDYVKFLQEMKHYIITYGFSSKASITTSSVSYTMFKDDFMLCLQNSISTKSGLIIEPQEYRLKVDYNEINPNNILAAASFALINDIDLSSFDIIR